MLLRKKWGKCFLTSLLCITMSLGAVGCGKTETTAESEVMTESSESLEISQSEQETEEKQAETEAELTPNGLEKILLNVSTSATGESTTVS